jgi:hypothetical protein
MSVITDSYTLNIQIIEHGIAHLVLPITFPARVEKDEPFDITYITKNEGAVVDDLNGHLLVNGAELPDSAWIETNVPVNNTVEKTYHHPGINVSTVIVIEVGHK